MAQLSTRYVDSNTKNFREIRIQKIYCFLSIYTSCCLCCCCKNKNEDDNDEEEVVFDSWNFYKSRFTRILPVYYLTLLYALPLFFLGHLYDVRPDNWGFGIGGTILAIFLQQTVLFNTNTYFGPNGASWTVSTLFFFYWFYPRSVIVYLVSQLSY